MGPMTGIAWKFSLNNRSTLQGKVVPFGSLHSFGSPLKAMKASCPSTAKAIAPTMLAIKNILPSFFCGRTGYMIPGIEW